MLRSAFHPQGPMDHPALAVVAVAPYFKHVGAEST